MPRSDSPSTETARGRGVYREAFKHAAVYSGASLLARTISFLLLPFYAHILRDIGYGVMGMIDATLVFVSSLVATNLHDAVVRLYHDEPDEDRKSNVVSTGTLLMGAVLLPLVVLGVVFSKPLSSLLLGTTEYWHLICIAFASFATEMIGRTAESILIIKRRSATYSFLSLVRLILGLSMNILLVVVLRWDLTGYFLATLISSAVGGVAAVVVMLRHCPLRWDREIAIRLIRFQAPLVPGSIASFFSRQIERVLVRYQIGLASLGVLQMGYKFPVLISILVITPIIKSWTTKSYEIADQPGGARRIGDMFIYFLYVSVLAFLVLAVNIKSLLQLLTPPEFWEAWRIAVIQAAHMIVRGSGQYFTFGLSYAKRTDLVARITIVTSVVKVGLSYLLISTYGLYGAAWSALFIAIVVLIWRAVYSQRFYRLSIDWGKVVLVVGTAAIVWFGSGQLTTEQIAEVGQPVIGGLDQAAGALRGTWLGDWRDGKILDAVVERSPLILDLVVRTLMLGAYLLILPVVHIETQRKITGFVRRLLSRSARS